MGCNNTDKWHKKFLIIFCMYIYVKPPYMWLSRTKELISRLLLSNRKVAFSLRAGFSAMLKTTWLLWVVNRKLSKLHIYLPIFKTVMKKLSSGKVLPTSVLLCTGWAHVPIYIPQNDVKIQQHTFVLSSGVENASKGVSLVLDILGHWWFYPRVKVWS